MKATPKCVVCEKPQDNAYATRCPAPCGGKYGKKAFISFGRKSPAAEKKALKKQAILTMLANANFLALGDHRDRTSGRSMTGERFALRRARAKNPWEMLFACKTHMYDDGLTYDECYCTPLGEAKLLAMLIAEEEIIIRPTILAKETIGRVDSLLEAFKKDIALESDKSYDYLARSITPSSYHELQSLLQELKNK